MPYYITDHKKLCGYVWKFAYRPKECSVAHVALLRQKSTMTTGSERTKSGRGCTQRSQMHVLAETRCDNALWFEGSALPMTVLNEKVSLVGDVPEDRYHLLLAWFLTSELGGPIPLDVDASGLGSTSQRSVGQT